MVSHPTFIGLANFPDVEEERDNVGSGAGVVVGESHDPGSVDEIDANFNRRSHLSECSDDGVLVAG
ncbi:MAG: hypothetical protein O6650_05245 [Actinobacteria bacterium]|nr:hypothetical protein [Actinomycetota bacterium]